MSKPAARVGDQGSPPHAPPPLTPGPGSSDVSIGDRPAWRANLDKKVCATPIAPPAPAPHGPESASLGSLSVMINDQMAVRQGDILVGAGPPNTIMLGLRSVLIGDIGFGLADASNMDEFCSDFAALVDDWENLTPEERRQQLEDMINRQLDKSGVPRQSVTGSASHAPGNAQYDFGRGSLEVSQASLNSPTLNSGGARQLANSLYHEARHAEQWSLMARHAAGQGRSAAQISSGMGVTPGMAQSASANPLSGVSPQGNLGRASYESVYGSGGQNRNNVLNDINNRYDEYRALPEEQDAWSTGDATPCGAPAP